MDDISDVERLITFTESLPGISDIQLHIVYRFGHFPTDLGPWLIGWKIFDKETSDWYWSGVFGQYEGHTAAEAAAKAVAAWPK